MKKIGIFLISFVIAYFTENQLNNKPAEEGAKVFWAIIFSIGTALIF